MVHFRVLSPVSMKSSVPSTAIFASELISWMASHDDVNCIVEGGAFLGEGGADVEGDEDTTIQVDIGEGEVFKVGGVLDHCETRGGEADDRFVVEDALEEEFVVAGSDEGEVSFLARFERVAVVIEVGDDCVVGTRGKNCAKLESCSSFQHSFFLSNNKILNFIFFKKRNTFLVYLFVENMRLNKNGKV